MDVIIRELQESDQEAIKGIYVEFLRFHAERDPLFAKTPGAVEAWGRYVYDSSAQPDCQVLVAELQGQVVGYCLGRITEKPPIYAVPRVGEVANLGVKEGFKRQGLGEQLFAAMKAWFRSEGITQVEVQAAARNPQAVNFWTQMGGREFIKRLVFTLEEAE